MSSSDGGLILRTLVDANVQFVVVGEPDAASALRLVVSRHPTNLEALGRALDALGASLRTAVDEEPGLHRIGDQAGTVAVRTTAGDVDLLFGGAHASLYADTLERAAERVLAGVTVQWSEEPAPPEPPGRVLGRRLRSMAEDLAQMMERREDREGSLRTPGGREPASRGNRPPPGTNRAAGGAEQKEQKEEPGTDD